MPQAKSDTLTAETVELLQQPTHTTFSPNRCRGGVKINVIPDLVDKALGDLTEEVESLALTTQAWLDVCELFLA